MATARTPSPTLPPRAATLPAPTPGGMLTDEQYSAVQWLAISMNAALENPLVAERNKDSRGAYEIFADSSGTPTPRTRLSGCAF